MPRRSQQSESAESRAVREVAAEDEDAMQALAVQAGPPPDSQRQSEADEDAIWAQMDPNVDHEQLAPMLMTQGIPPEMLGQFLAFKVHPEWKEHFSQPTQDAEKADQNAKLLKYPFRMTVLPDPTIDPEAYVRKAEQMDRRYQKRMAQHLDAPIQVGMPPRQGV